MKLFGSVQQALEANNTELLSKCGKLQSEVDNLNYKYNGLMMECERLINEIRYLKQRNKELRQKSWFEVYEENLKLQQELKQYKAVLESVENFVGRFQDEKR